MKENNNSSLQIIIFVLIGLITILAIYIIVDSKTNNVVNRLLEIEYQKVGGKSNYDKINDIQRKQIIEGLKQYDTQVGGKEKQAENNNQVPSGNTSKISIEQVKDVTTNNTYILGDKDAEITWIEYSDLECPYCKKLYESGVIEEIMNEYDGKVNFIFKQFPLGFHEQAQMEAEASLCVGDIGGKDKFYEFITKTFNGSKGNGKSYTKESISDLAGTIGIDKNDVLSCINSGKFTDEAKRQTEEGSSIFGITGTPGNVLLNNKTGEWDKLPGAYPKEAFKQKIDNLLTK